MAIAMPIRFRSDVGQKGVEAKDKRTEIDPNELRIRKTFAHPRRAGDLLRLVYEFAEEGICNSKKTRMPSR